MQERIVRKIDARDDVLRAKGDLLGLGEEVIDNTVEHQPTDAAHRYLFLGDDLRRVEDVEGEFVGKRFVEQLQPELPFRKVAGLDRVPQVAPMEIGVGAVDLERLYSSGTCTQVRASGSRE